MQLKTHFWVGFALSVYISYFLQPSLIPKIFWFVLAPCFGFVAIAPDFLDNLCHYSNRYDTCHYSNHYRHPLTHSPWTVSYFVALSLLLPAEPIFMFFTLHLGIAWCSHLFLDALNPTGLPLLLSPALSNAEAKYYSHKRINHQTKRLVLGNVNYNNTKWNHGFYYSSLLAIILIIVCLMFDLTLAWDLEALKFW